LRGEIQLLEYRIKGRQPTLTADARIPEAKARLRAAKRPPAATTPGEWTNQQAETRQAQAWLAELKQQVKDRPAAEKANVADEAALVDLRRRLATAEAAHGQAMLEPGNMKWPD
jgi:hypothetical protein